MLLPSEKESFGLVALEAMACGVPTCATNTGGVPEVVQHGVTGFLSNVGDVRQMAENAIRLLQEKELYEQFSIAGIQRVGKYFSADKIGSQYEQLYKNVMKESVNGL